MNPNLHIVWPDVALLFLIGFFALLCAVLIIKESRLGWAMFAKCVAYSLAFNYGALMLLFPAYAHEDVRRLIRVIVAVAVSWAIYELVALRVRRWRERRVS